MMKRTREHPWGVCGRCGREGSIRDEPNRSAHGYDDLCFACWQKSRRLEEVAEAEQAECTQATGGDENE
jgi:hypothetical protein